MWQVLLDVALQSGQMAPDDDALRRDVELARAMGFNGVRKRQKIEDPRYLHWADRIGLARAGWLEEVDRHLATLSWDLTWEQMHFHIREIERRPTAGVPTNPPDSPAATAAHPAAAHPG